MNYYSEKSFKRLFTFFVIISAFAFGLGQCDVMKAEWEADKYKRAAFRYYVRVIPESIMNKEKKQWEEEELRYYIDEAIKIHESAGMEGCMWIEDLEHWKDSLQNIQISD